MPGGEVHPSPDIPCHDLGDGAANGKGRAVKKILGWVVLLLLIFYIGTNPGPAADITQGISTGVAQVFRNIGLFFSHLAS